jgi:hypothetical protein
MYDLLETAHQRLSQQGRTLSNMIWEKRRRKRSPEGIVHPHPSTSSWSHPASKEEAFSAVESHYLSTRKSQQAIHHSEELYPLKTIPIIPERRMEISSGVSMEKETSSLTTSALHGKICLVR